MRGGRFLSCRHGAMGVVHLVVVHGPGHGVDFSGIVCSNDMFVERSKDFFLSSLVKTWRAHFFFSPRMISKIFFIILGEKKSARQPGVRFFSRLHNLKKHFDHTGTRVPTLNNMICASSSIF